MQNRHDIEKRIDDCRRLYLKYEGRHHELIDKEMRELGHEDFHRRILYSRFERGRHRPGWIERFGWERLLLQSSEPAELSGGSAAVMCGKAEPFRPSQSILAATPPFFSAGAERLMEWDYIQEQHKK
jgi:hypothetical protein